MILYIYTLLLCFIMVHADFTYLLYYYRPKAPAVFEDEVNLNRDKIYTVQSTIHPYKWEYLEEEKVLYDKCGGNNPAYGRLKYYDPQFSGAYYEYLVREHTEYFCDLTQRLVLKTGAILEGCKAPETWYYKVPILDTEEDN